MLAPLLLAACLAGELLDEEGVPAPVEDVAAARAEPVAGYAAFDTDTDAALRVAVQDALATGRLPRVAGLSLAVLHGDRAWSWAMGVTQQRRATPATPRTPYRLASITKTMTAIVAMQLVEEGRLDLDAPIGRYVAGSSARWAGVTVRHLLSHTGGIRHYPAKGPERRLRAHLSTAQTVALIAKKKLAAKPGATFLYSTYGYDLLGAAIEAIEGRQFDEVLRARLFDPLGMTSMALEDSRARRDDWPDGLRVTRRGRVLPSVAIDVSSRFAGGGVRGAVVDLIPYADALLRQQLASQSSWRAMTTPTQTTSGVVADYGLGFAVYPQRGHFVVAHAGGQPETSSLLYMLPSEGVAVALATNLEGQGKALSAVAQAIVEVLIEGGVPRRELVTRDQADGTVALAMTRLVSWGRATVDAPWLARRARHTRDLAEVADGTETAAAFASLARVLDEPMLAPHVMASTRALIRDLHTPAQGAATPLAGAHIVRALRDADAGAYAVAAANGPLAVVNAYVALCARDTSRCPLERRLPSSLEARVTRLAASYETVAPLAVRKLRRHELVNVEVAQRSLGPMIGADAYPDFSEDLLVAVSAQLERRPRDAASLAHLASALAPWAPLARLAHAEALFLLDDDEAATRALAEAWSMFGAQGLPSEVLLARGARLRALEHPRAEHAAEGIMAFARAHFAPLQGANDPDIHRPKADEFPSERALESEADDDDADDAD